MRNDALRFPAPRRIVEVSYINRLQDKLAKLGATGATDRRGQIIRAPDKNGLLRAILHALDETILARALTFQNDADHTVVFEVAARRLLRLTSQSGGAKSLAADTIIGKSFSAEGGPLVDALAALLDDFLDGTSQLIVRSAKLSRATSPSDIGCSADMLAQAWSLDLYGDQEASTTDLVEKFVAACAQYSTASVQFDGENIHQTTGQPDELGRLGELARCDLTHLDQLLDRCLPDADTPRCVVVRIGHPDHRLILYVSSGAEKALVMVAQEHLADIHRLWRDIDI